MARRLRPTAGGRIAADFKDCGRLHAQWAGAANQHSQESRFEGSTDSELVVALGLVAAAAAEEAGEFQLSLPSHVYRTNERCFDGLSLEYSVLQEETRTGCMHVCPVRMQQRSNKERLRSCSAGTVEYSLVLRTSPMD